MNLEGGHNSVCNTWVLIKALAVWSWQVTSPARLYHSSSENEGIRTELWFSNTSMHEKHLYGLFHHCWASPQSFWFSGWREWDFAFEQVSRGCCSGLGTTLCEPLKQNDLYGPVSPNILWGFCRKVIYCSFYHLETHLNHTSWEVLWVAVISILLRMVCN